ncbi:unnamed protein product [Musa textilis]
MTSVAIGRCDIHHGGSSFPLFLLKLFYHCLALWMSFYVLKHISFCFLFHQFFPFFCSLKLVPYDMPISFLISKLCLPFSFARTSIENVCITENCCITMFVRSTDF